MQKLIVYFLLSIPLFSAAQNIDSTVIRQVDSLLQVSKRLTDTNEFEKALEVNTIAKNIAIEKLGKETVSYGNVCFNLGRIFDFKDDNLEAEKWYIQSKIIWEKVLGKEHPYYMAILNNLGYLYYKMGQYEKSTTFYLEEIGIREKVSGKEHPLYVESLSSLATLYFSLGKFEKAESLLLEVKAIREKVLGKEHLDYAKTLNDLAGLYKELGQYEKAETLHLESKEILGKILGKEHPDYAASLNNLAILYMDTKQYKKAEPLFLEAKAIVEKVFGKEHPDYGMFLNNLTNIYVYMGQFEKAEPLFLEVKGILERVQGKEHPNYGICLINLGALYVVMGQYEKAEAPYLEAKVILEKSLGKEHPHYVETLKNLAGLYKNLCQYEKAEFFFTDAAQLDRALISSALRYLSEQEINKYLLTFKKGESRIFSFNQKIGGITGISKTGYDNTLFLKGFLLNAYNHIKKLIFYNATATENYKLLQTYGRLLAAEYAKPVAERKEVTELEERSNETEKKLARTVAGYGQVMKQVKWQEVQQRLAKGEAAIEFVSYIYADKVDTDSTMYAALLLKPGDVQPKFVPLFEERLLDSLLQFNIIFPTKTERKEYINRLYLTIDDSTSINKNPRTTLYDLVWKPLETELIGTKVIYFSPTGLLHRINLGAIAVSEKQNLSDKFQLVELISTRQLVIPNEMKRINNNAVLFGGIKFDPDSSLQGSNLTTETSISRSWEELPWTEREVNTLEKIMKATGVKTFVRKGSNATEESFKKLISENSPSPRILHIATHGYFFPDPNEKASSDSLTAMEQEPVFKTSDNPMLRSGLILAGGNAGWEGKKILKGKEDGILTAYEISQMNLSNTELVVLSSCETGLGTIQGNEGVYGLQRAFKIAGAKYLIMSLWQVPDKQTSLLMTAFYKKWLIERKPIPEAFYEAQQELRKSGSDLINWAGFVLVK